MREALGKHLHFTKPPLAKQPELLFTETANLLEVETKVMTYQELQAALEIFGLGERATLQKIKDRHRELVKQHHPDHNKNNTDGMMLKINAAYEILESYCENYQFCFSETEFLEQLPEERLRRQFGWDPLWGGKKEDPPE